MDNLKNIVLLIDADNTQLSALNSVMREVSARGRIAVKRAYGNWKKDTLKNWEGELKRLAIKAEQQFDYVAHKNATDIALVIDAMQLLNKSIYDAFVIVSSDNDFTPLAIALRESGMYVMGVGDDRTADSFRNSCDEFIFLKNIADNAAVEEKLPESGGKAPAGEKQQKKAESKKKAAARKEAEEKLEAQVRSFFGQHFKKQIYRDKKEEIIQAVVKAKTKSQVNNSLMKHFDNQEVSTIYHKLEPLIKDMPGQ